MSIESQENRSTPFMLEEYRDLYQNVMHLENKLFNHLSFFTTLFLGILTASVAVIQLTPSQAMSLKDALALLTLPFGLLYIVGRFEIRMTTELRVRKMKFIEGITKLREYFVNVDQSIEDYLIMPSKLEKAPPTLRVGSQDWYQLLYLCLMNSISFLVSWTGSPYLFTFVVNTALNTQRYVPLILFALWEGIGLVLAVVVFWKFSYRNVMDFCADFDRKREERMKKPIDYDMLDRPLPKSRLSWTFSDWIRYIEKGRRIG